MKETPFVQLHCSGKEADVAGFLDLLRLGIWREPGLL